jgi:thiosulfate dehydrogenase [quinone] large subunit
VPNNDLLLPDLNLYMSPLIALALILAPTIFLLKYGWEDKITDKMIIFPLRLALAYEFLHGGIEKLIDPTYVSSPGLIGLGAANAPSPWIQYVMTLMLPNYEFYLLLIAWGELLIGLSMLFGGFTRLGAIGGVIMQWTFLFLLGWLSISTFGVNFVGSLAFMAVGMYQAGRFAGLDQFLGPKLNDSTNKFLRIIGWLT